jgi:hypothetical protein
MWLKTDQFKATVACVVICCFMATLCPSAALAVQDIDDAAIVQFSQRLEKIKLHLHEADIGSAQMFDMYADLQNLEQDLMAADEMLQSSDTADDCKFIMRLALVWLTLGTRKVTSLVVSIISLSAYPPDTQLGTIRAYISLARQAISTIINGSIDGANFILCLVQYGQCRKTASAS